MPNFAAIDVNVSPARTVYLVAMSPFGVTHVSRERLDSAPVVEHRRIHSAAASSPLRMLQICRLHHRAFGYRPKRIPAVMPAGPKPTAHGRLVRPFHDGIQYRSTSP